MVMNLWVFVSKTCHQTLLHTWLVIWRPPLMLLFRLCAVLYEIYRPDSKPLSLMLPVNASVQDVMSAIVKPGGDHILIKMNSTGGGTCKKRKSFKLPHLYPSTVIWFFLLLVVSTLCLKRFCMNLTQKELSSSWMPLQSTPPWGSMRDFSSVQAAKWNNW